MRYALRYVIAMFINVSNMNHFNSRTNRQLTNEMKYFVCPSVHWNIGPRGRRGSHTLQFTCDYIECYISNFLLILMSHEN